MRTKSNRNRFPKLCLYIYISVLGFLVFFKNLMTYSAHFINNNINIQHVVAR